MLRSQEKLVAALALVLAAAALWAFIDRRGERTTLHSPPPLHAEVAERRPGPELDSALLVPPSLPEAARVEQPSAAVAPARASTDPEASTTVFGRVLDEEGAPFDGLELSLFETRSTRKGVGRSAATQTSADGRFRFERVARGPWTLQATGGGTCDGLRQELDTSRGDVELELTARRGHALLVRARWSDGSPVHALSVTHRELAPDGSLGRVGGASVTSALEDYLTLRGFCAGEYELRIASLETARAGLAIARVRVPAPGPVELVLDENVAELLGRVVDPLGVPIQGASVRFSPAGPAPASPVTTTAADGTFLIAGLEFGPGLLLVLDERHTSLEYGLPAGGELELAPGMPALELVLQPKPLVRGLVVDPRGMPVARAQVMGGGSQRPALTDAQGRFELHGQPGARVVYAQAKGHASSATQPLALVAGQLVDGVVLELRAACRVLGRVLGPDGAPFPEADVRVGGGSLRRIQAEAEFVLEGLPPEPAWIQAYDDDGGFVSLLVTPSPERDTEIELRLPARAPVAFELEFTRAGAPLEASARLQTPGFLRGGSTIGQPSNLLTLELQTNGRWRGVLELPTAAPDDLSARRLFELTVPRQASFTYSLDWNALRAPTSPEELARWLTE